jgi:hypothetical protein
VKHQLCGKLFRRLNSGTRSAFPSGFHAALPLGHFRSHKEDQVPVVLTHSASKGSSFLINNAPERDDSKKSSVLGFADLGRAGGWSPSNIS